MCMNRILFSHSHPRNYLLLLAVKRIEKHRVENFRFSFRFQFHHKRTTRGPFTLLLKSWKRERYRDGACDHAQALVFFLSFLLFISVFPFSFSEKRTVCGIESRGKHITVVDPCPKCLLQIWCLSDKVRGLSVKLVEIEEEKFEGV